MSSRRSLLKHLWSMVQTRVEAASLVVQLQRTAVTQGLVYYGIAAVTALSFMTAVIVWIAVAAPPAWRAWALALVALALLGATVFSVVTAGRKLRGDAELIADFKQGLKLDLAMLSLAMKDADPDDEKKLAEREQAKEKVREAAAEKAATPSTAADGEVPAAGSPAHESARAALRAAAPRADVSSTPSEVSEAVRSAGASPPPPKPSAEPPPAKPGYGFTAGGTYASTAPAPGPIVEDHAMPESMGQPHRHPPSGNPRDIDRKQGHGST